ncbi:MAG: sulfatase-like hydrolase/transferase [Candidatus Aminicenantales bacterium]
MRKTRRMFRLFVWAGLIGGALLVVPFSALGRDRPNVLMITVDTLRADRLSCYGSGRVATPNIDRLARRGFVFSRPSAMLSGSKSRLTFRASLSFLLLKDDAFPVDLSTSNRSFLTSTGDGLRSADTSKTA